MDKTQAEILFGVLNQIKDIKQYHDLYARIIEKLVIEAGIDLGTKPGEYKLISKTGYNGISYYLERTTDGHCSFLVCEVGTGHIKSYDKLVDINDISIHNSIPDCPGEFIVLFNKGTPEYVYDIATKEFITFEKSALAKAIRNRGN